MASIIGPIANGASILTTEDTSQNIANALFLALGSTTVYNIEMQGAVHPLPRRYYKNIADKVSQKLTY